MALVDASSTSSGSSGSNAAWLGGGAAAVVATGAGLAAYSRRKRTKQTASMTADARDINPKDTGSLMALPIDVLEKLSQEELVSTDESIRKARAELDMATAEFGAERTRSFVRALNHSTTTLQRAFGIRAQLDDTIPESEAERRAMLVDIVSSCGQADDALDAEAENFAALRDVLINADSNLAKLTQTMVDLRGRLPQAEQTLDRLPGPAPGEHAHQHRRQHPVGFGAFGTRRHRAERRTRTHRPACGPARRARRSPPSCRKIHPRSRQTAGGHRTRGGKHPHGAVRPVRAGHGGGAGKFLRLGRCGRAGRGQGTQADWASLDDAGTRSPGRIVEQARDKGGDDPLGAYTALGRRGCRVGRSARPTCANPPPAKNDACRSWTTPWRRHNPVLPLLRT